MTDRKDMIYEEPVNNDIPAWAWKTDWCKENGLNPRSRDSWERAQEAYEKMLIPYIPTEEPRPLSQDNKEPIKIKDKEDIRSYNVGSSDYATKKIQPWSIWEEYNLNPWEADIVKRILRKKMIPGKTEEEARIEDLEKIIHVCKELIRQLKLK